MNTKTHAIFVTSYAPDFPWLRYLLDSIDKFAVGFEETVVAVPPADRERAETLFARPRVRIAEQLAAPEGATKWGRFLRAQHAMLCGDQYTRADVVWLFGSDCFVYDRLTPEMGMHDGRPIMPFVAYADVAPPGSGPWCWKPSTEFMLNIPEVPFEFMRRLPLLYPRGLYGAVREHVEGAHKAEFADVLWSSESRGLMASESNILGAWAWFCAPRMFDWRRAGERPDVEFPVAQFWSHGGLDRPCDEHHRLSGVVPRDFMEGRLA